MNRWSASRLLGALLFGILLPSISTPGQAQWTAPTPEELSMTSQPEVPGARAVYLFREETTDDKLHVFSIYIRLKVLTEGGKEFANVELPYTTGARSRSVDGIAGRTIHSDGTVIPFIGKPYEKLVEKTKGMKVMAKVFTLPDVQVGSILEYRYELRYDDNVLYSPQWYIQSELWTRKGHYRWRPIDLNGNVNVMSSRGDRSSTISWTPILPAGTEVKQSRLPGTGLSPGQAIIDLDVHDIPPTPEEEYMPPIQSFTYRVLFYYTAYRTPDEFWKNEGKYWSKEQDKFIGPGPGVRTAVNDLTIPTDSQDQKLRKFYAAVMKMENTNFTRSHSTSEEKSDGFKEIRSTDDIWAHKRGTSDQLTMLFVAMARAAGMKAYVAAVTNRDRHLFLKYYLTLDQLDDDIAIVNVNGKDAFFDPGSRYCPYQHLAWEHTMTQGLRQVDGGATITDTVADTYTFSRVQRVANLTLDDGGALSGSIKMTYNGSPALQWRQRALAGDATSLDEEIRTSVEHIIPSEMQIKVLSVENLTDYDAPLVVNFDVRGGLGSSTGKRVLLPGDLFEANSTPAFPHEKRETPVSFLYPSTTQDAVRITFPAKLNVESLPASSKFMLQTFAAYDLTTSSTATSFTCRRNYLLGNIIFMPNEYGDLRSFYSKMESKDQESVVLTAAPVVVGKAGSAGN